MKCHHTNCQICLAQFLDVYLMSLRCANAVSPNYLFSLNRRFIPGHLTSLRRRSVLPRARPLIFRCAWVCARASASVFSRARLHTQPQHHQKERPASPLLALETRSASAAVVLFIVQPSTGEPHKGEDGLLDYISDAYRWMNRRYRAGETRMKTWTRQRCWSGRRGVKASSAHRLLLRKWLNHFIVMFSHPLQLQLHANRWEILYCKSGKLIAYRRLHCMHAHSTFWLLFC